MVVKFVRRLKAAKIAGGSFIFLLDVEPQILHIMTFQQTKSTSTCELYELNRLNNNSRVRIIIVANKKDRAFDTAH